MIVVRWGLPLLIAAIGVYIARTSNEGVGEALVGAAVCLVVASVLMRIGFAGDREREEEEEARRYFDEHGRWPGEGGA
jgi:hypothetical protein